MRAHGMLVAAILAMILGPAAPASARTSEEAPAEGEAAQQMPGFLPVSDIVIPVVSRGRFAGYVMVKASLEFPTPDIAKSAQPWLPKIMDAWIRTMYGLAQRGHFENGTVDPELLKKQLLQAAIDTLKEGAPTDVLITQALFTRAS
ncbi:hypothetical protein [Benzoatithermus flavus]|uniref:Flagellar protein FliL n=1 Tax=Benzoatithermus flavus TaxID=3108223 RepID=A0ABU8XUY4_9PROT